jgi:hypothetical protein
VQDRGPHRKYLVVLSLPYLLSYTDKSASVASDHRQMLV